MTKTKAMPVASIHSTPSTGWFFAEIDVMPLAAPPRAGAQAADCAGYRAPPIGLPHLTSVKAHGARAG
ncbi:hypothetical protein [Rhodobacter capsulatus]|uniref:hypothetical protein n=1 Tax=Rhodobacter capsulatus TaxID=1061 RepID=UPI00402805B7